MNQDTFYCDTGVLELIRGAPDCAKMLGAYCLRNFQFIEEEFQKMDLTDFKKHAVPLSHGSCEASQAEKPRWSPVHINIVLKLCISTKKTLGLQDDKN